MKTGKMGFAAALAIIVFAMAHGTDLRAAKPDTLFPTDLPGKSWVSFGAAGFSKPACGVIYRFAQPTTCGMPLGAIDTGCIDLETSGLLGYCTIFNTHVPRRGPLNLPFLGIGVGGQTWVLCDPSQTKPYGSPHPETSPYQLRRGYPPVLEHLSLEGVRTAREIHYWGHYPVADLEYETDAPVSVGLRAWSPFLPGNVKGSLMPGIVFEVRLRNLSDADQQGAVALSFPGPTPGEAGTDQFRRERVRGSFAGTVVNGRLASYALGVIGRDRLRLGGELGASGAAWAGIERALPEAAQDHPGASAAVDFALGPGETKVVRFLLTWHAPTWKGGGSNFREGTITIPKALPMENREAVTSPADNTYTHMYAKYYPSALRSARELAREHKSLLRRILAWQEVIHTDEAIPVWLRESLVNVLHLITETGLWAQAGPPLPDWVRPEDGLFGMNEDPRSCPNMECLPVTFFAQAPLVYFFPELALSNLRGYKGFQNPDGALPIVWSGMLAGRPYADFIYPFYDYQVTTNPTSYLTLVHRYWLVTGDETFLREFYPSLKKAVLFMVNLNPGTHGIISMPDRLVDAGTQGNTEWYEMSQIYQGAKVPAVVSHTGGLKLAGLRMGEAWAQKVGDKEFAQQCRQWIEAGAESMETRMWDGTHYLDFWEPETDRKSDVVHAFQLDGEWIVRSHGLDEVFRRDRVKTTLETIKRLNAGPANYGAMPLVRVDGTPVRRDACTIGVLMLAMNYMYYGQRDFGTEVARSMWKGFVCEQGYTWNMPAEYHTDIGKRCGAVPGDRPGGQDYSHNMVLWALPAALEGKDMSATAEPGGLADRVLRAARGL